MTQEELDGWDEKFEAYGDWPEVREAVERGGRLYVLGVPCNTMVYAGMKAPASEYLTRPKQVSKTVARWPASKWHRYSAIPGEKGPRAYDWAYQRITETRRGALDPPFQMPGHRNSSCSTRTSRREPKNP